LQELDLFMDHLRVRTEGQRDQFETCLTKIQANK